MEVQKITYFIIIFSILFNAHAQNEKDYCEQWRNQMDTILDTSLQLKLSKRMISIVDSKCKVEILIKLGYNYSGEKKIDSALYFYNQALVLLKNTDNNELLASVYTKKSNTLIEDSKYEEGILFLKKARKILNKDLDNYSWVTYYEGYKLISLRNNDYHSVIKYNDSLILFAERIKDTLNLLDYHHFKGISQFKSSNYEQAVETFLHSIKLKEKYNKLNQIDASYHILGVCYTRFEQYKIAKKYFQKCIAITKEKGDEHTLLTCYPKLARCYQELGENDMAIKILDTTIALSKKLKDNVEIAKSFKGKGWIYLENLREYKKAEDYFIKAYEIAKLTEDDIDLYPYIRGVIEVCLKQGFYKKSKKYLKLFEEVTHRIKTLAHTQEFHRIYSEYYEKIGNSTLALDHLKKYYRIKDSISNQQVQTQVADLEKKYDTKKKELEIVTLNQEKKEQEQLIQLATSKQRLYLLASGFLLFLLGVGTWTFIKLRKQKSELINTNQVKNRLFSIIAHDLRGMIIPFQRSGKILKYHIGKGNHEKTIELSQEIEKNSESLSNMLDNLLNWSLEQMNGYKMNPEQISIEKELKGIIKSYEQEATFKNTNINLKYEENIAIKFDKGAFHVIFRNLISNALKYTENGNIRIEFKRDFNTLLCSVIDTGVGMSKEQLQNVFTFEEGKTTVGTQGEKGTGIGLNLVFRFVKMHKGSIKVSSEKRIGTRFDLTFPKLEPLTTDHSDDLESMSA